MGVHTSIASKSEATINMKTNITIQFLIALMFLVEPLCYGQVQYVVPGEANIWLSGMPIGTTASPGDISGPDISPDQSPTLALGLSMVPQQEIRFLVAGGVSRGDWQISHPDGVSSTSHLAATEHGICGITAPFQCLIGVFLGPERPDLSPPATPLSFSTIASRDGSAYSPVLKQPFFIGDGKNSLGQLQKFKIPQGATRLFLGSNDSYGWRYNKGIFLVSILTGETSQAETVAVSMCPSIRVTGQVGVNYRIEASTNMEDWELMSRFVLPSSPSVFYDQEYSSRSKRFYRLVQEPSP